ncbi:uncharacterized protein Lrp2_3 [Zeugodacus cucurbitae]|uniref:Low-density lipoprotein receptor-related protein 2 n=1 Tax=Zeugodacus cucurbitae TaxID=28588 RepID=A0A0A1XPN0_ZEUCU|nr:uncharacterized protein Lrp2_3 [Zeugodacus cucurbitae]
MFKYFKYLLCAQIVICQIYTVVSSNDDWLCNDKVNTTIAESKVCDGSVDCSNGRDETARICAAKVCKEHEYRCAYGACISAELKCNKQIDCYDRSDETEFLCMENVFDKIQGSCSDEEFQCDSGECIDVMDMCNGFTDCQDASDETVNSCAHIECSDASFRCAYGACINLKQVANQVWDCADGSDEPVVDEVLTDTVSEVEKDVAMPVTCSIPYDKPNLLISLNKTGETNRNLRLFDKILRNDTVDFKCLPGFQLFGMQQLKCVDNDWYREWPHCERTTPILPCKASEVACENGDCIESARICNGVKDCADGSDEILPKCVNLTCTKNEYRCKYGACIPDGMKCNKVIDCADGSDETTLLCTQDYNDYARLVKGNCESEELAQCRLGSDECILIEDLCNGRTDCSDGHDETVEMCAHVECSDSSFTCAYGACIPYTALCDGEVDCADGSDEYAELCASIIEENEKYEAKYNFDDSYAANLEKFDAMKEKEILVEEVVLGTTTSSILTENNTTNTDYLPEMKPFRRPVILTEKSVPQRRCLIPANRVALRAINAAENVTLKVGSQIDNNTIVKFSCEDTWYLVDGDTDVLCMATGEWSSAVPKCEKRCPPLWNGISTNTTCIYKNELADCQAYSKPDTTAIVTCAESYKQINKWQKLSCGIDGEWDKTKLKCQPKCVKQTKENPTNMAVVVNIFRLSPDERNPTHLKYKKACSGTILSPKLVLTHDLCLNRNDLKNSIAGNDPILYTILPSSMSIESFGQYEQLNGRHNISQIILADGGNSPSAPAIIVLVDYFAPALKPICLKFPLSCGSNENGNSTTGLIEGTAILNSDACFVVVSRSQFIYMDEYQQWLEIKMSLHNYLL